MKFSAGQQRRALLEAKLLRSSTLVRGAEAQLPQNLRSQRIRCGYSYLCVGYTDANLHDDRLSAVEETRRTRSGRPGGADVPRFVEALAWTSASRCSRGRSLPRRAGRAR